MRGALCVAAAVAAALFFGTRVFELSREVSAANARAERNAAAARAAVERFRVADSLSAASASALEVSAKEARRREGELLAAVAALRIRARDVRSATTIVTVAADTVYMPSPAPPPAADTCVEAVDGWAAVSLCLSAAGGAAVSYSVRDTVEAVVHVRHRRRFLWWRWSPEYRATVLSRNPSVEVAGVAAVVVEK